MFVAVVLVLLATGVAAAWIPARSAANVDPSSVLRQD
jgi:ABC-type lipoprotein release transport system permease subunit